MTDALVSPAPPRFLPAAWIIGTLRAQGRMWSEAFCLWVGRPLPSVAHDRRLGDGRRFGLQRGSWMGVLVPMVVFSQFVDVLVMQGVIHVMAAPRHRLALHAALLFVSLWSVVWAVALRSAMRHVDHRLDAHALTLAIGFKQLCRLPLAAIADVRVIDHRAARNGQDWHDVCGVKRREVTTLASLDPPTLLIALRDGASGAWRTSNGLRKPLARRVAVYVDEPAAMRSAIVDALPRAAPPVTLGNVD